MSRIVFVLFFCNSGNFVPWIAKILREDAHLREEEISSFAKYDEWKEGL